MRIITLQQPWAGAVVHGRIDVINARYATKHRGPLLIHAGRPDHSFPKPPPPGISVRQHAGVTACASAEDFGFVLGVVEVTGVAEMDECQLPYAGGGPGAFVWLVKDPRRFLRPVDLRRYFSPCEASRDLAEFPLLVEALKAALPPDQWMDWHHRQQEAPKSPGPDTSGYSNWAGD